jgi:hypothetical protein
MIGDLEINAARLQWLASFIHIKDDLHRTWELIETEGIIDKYVGLVETPEEGGDISQSTLLSPSLFKCDKHFINVLLGYAHKSIVHLEILHCNSYNFDIADKLRDVRSTAPIDSLYEKLIQLVLFRYILLIDDQFVNIGGSQYKVSSRGLTQSFLIFTALDEHIKHKVSYTESEFYIHHRWEQHSHWSPLNHKDHYRPIFMGLHSICTCALTTYFESDKKLDETKLMETVALLYSAPVHINHWRGRDECYLDFESEFMSTTNKVLQYWKNELIKIKASKKI